MKRKWFHKNLMMDQSSGVWKGWNRWQYECRNLLQIVEKIGFKFTHEYCSFNQSFYHQNTWRRGDRLTL
jgi:hypothetical protein